MLEKINEPKDLKKLSLKELESLVQEIRDVLLKKLSIHDFFKVGHTSTSISLASGFAKIRDLANDKYNVIAVIGNGLSNLIEPLFRY